MKPMLTSTKGFFSKIKKAAANQDPKALMEAAQGLYGKARSFMNGSYKQIDALLRPVANVMQMVGDPAVKWLQKLLQGAMLNFPIDYLVNHYLLKQDPFQALWRATGSSLGSMAANVATGGTGLIGGLGGIVGAEAGDLLMATLGNMLGADPAMDADSNLIYSYFPGAKWLTDYLLGLSPLSNGTGENTESVSVPAAKMTAIPSAATSLNTTLATTPTSPGNVATGRVAGHSEDPNEYLQVDIKATQTEASKSPLTSYLRNGNATGIAPSNTSKSGGSSVSNITLPATSIDLPSQGGETQSRISQKESNPIPSIPSGNTSMSFYETAAAKEFEVQLV